MWIVFGTGVKTTRVPGGAKVDRECAQCGEVASFYEKEVTSTFQLYFIDVFDYQHHRVMACGCCGACYATDELGAPGTQALAGARSATIGESAARAAHEVGGYIDRAAGALEAGVASLLSTERPPARVSNASTRGLRAAPEEMPREDEGDEDPLADPLEARFRVLEKKAGVRIKID
jgi:hypothetical protein